MVRAVIFFLFWMLPLLPVPAAHAQEGFCGLRNVAFQEGEKLEFKVYYAMGRIWVGAGEASFTTTRETLSGKSVLHVTGDGKTLKSYEWFYKVRDRYETYIDPEAMVPLKFVRNVNEGGFKIYNNVTFNHEAGRAVTTNGVFNVPRCIQDVVSSIFFARNIDYNRYQPGTRIPFKMFLDDKIYELYIRYLGKERIETKYGVFNAIKLSPLLIQGTVFKDNEKMVLWISDDNNHIPLRVDSPILVGSVKVDMIDFSGLRHPLTSLVKKK